jgi:hypothetical protein
MPDCLARYTTTSLGSDRAPLAVSPTVFWSVRGDATQEKGIRESLLANVLSGSGVVSRKGREGLESP